MTKLKILVTIFAVIFVFIIAGVTLLGCYGIFIIPPQVPSIECEEYCDSFHNPSCSYDCEEWYEKECLDGGGLNNTSPPPTYEVPTYEAQQEFYLILVNGFISNDRNQSGYFRESEQIRIETFSKHGMVFLGWFEKDVLVTQTNIFIMPNRNLTLEARFRPQEGNHTITLINAVFGRWEHFIDRHIVSYGFTSIGSFGTGGMLALGLIPASYIGEGAVFYGWFIDGVRSCPGSPNRPYFFAGGFPNNPLISPIPSRDIVVEARFNFIANCPELSESLDISMGECGRDLLLSISSRVEFLMPNGNWLEWATSDIVPLSMATRTSPFAGYAGFTQVRITPFGSIIINDVATEVTGVPILLYVNRIATEDVVTVTKGFLDEEFSTSREGLKFNMMSRVYSRRHGRWDFEQNGRAQVALDTINPSWRQPADAVRIQPESFGFNLITNTITITTGQITILYPPFSQETELFTLTAIGGIILRTGTNTGEFGVGLSIWVDFDCRIYPWDATIIFEGWFENGILVSLNRNFWFNMPNRNKTIEPRYRVVL